MPEKDRQIIWPIYFDASRTRKGGRMVSLREAVASPTLDMVITAAIKLGYKPEIERDKKHPKIWYEEGSEGRVLIPKMAPKSVVLKKISESIKSIGKKS